MNKKRYKTTNKKIFYIVGIIMTIIAIIGVIFVLQIKENGINVSILSTGDIGGTTKYEVTGAKSEIEANRAIIKKVYSNNEPFRAVTDQELQDIVNKISSSGCGQITESYTLGPPLNGAVNWTNFGNNNHDDIVVYMLDDQYLVYTECSNR